MPELGSDVLRDSVNVYCRRGGELYPDELPLTDEIVEKYYEKYVVPFLDTNGDYHHNYEDAEYDENDYYYDSAYDDEDDASILSAFQEMALYATEPAGGGDDDNWEDVDSADEAEEDDEDQDEEGTEGSFAQNLVMNHIESFLGMFGMSGPFTFHTQY